jgi:hypothetical protein
MSFIRSSVYRPSIGILRPKTRLPSLLVHLHLLPNPRKPPCIILFGQLTRIGSGLQVLEPDPYGIITAGSGPQYRDRPRLSIHTRFLGIVSHKAMIGDRIENL